MTAGLDEFDETPSPASLTAAARNFKGIALAPYSYGRRLLWRSIFGNVDAAASQVASFSLIFTLSISEDIAREFLFDVPAFKVAFGKWLDEREEGDYKIAVDLADVILAEAKKAEVKAVEEPGREPKKKA
jgi:hypothetical protein